MRTSTPLSCYLAMPSCPPSWAGGMFPLSGQWSMSLMSLVRTTRRFLAVCRRRTGTHIRSGKDPPRSCAGEPVLVAPDWSSERRLSRRRSSCSVRADSILRRCCRHQQAWVTRFAILAGEPIRPSLVEVKRTSHGDAQSIGEAHPKGISLTCSGLCETIRRSMAALRRAGVFARTCRRAVFIAPMALVTFQDVRAWARSIRTRVSIREMPAKKACISSLSSFGVRLGRICRTCVCADHPMISAEFLTGE
jgi:hypothetical protein